MITRRGNRLLTRAALNHPRRNFSGAVLGKNVPLVREDGGGLACEIYWGRAGRQNRNIQQLHSATAFSKEMPILFFHQP